MNKILKLSDKAYFEAEGLSHSFLIQFDRSPMHAQIGLKETAARIDGKINHLFILQPEIFNKKYFILPSEIKDKRSKLYREFAESEIKELLLFDYFQKLESVKNNLLNYELIDGLSFEYILNNSEKEISIFWEDKIEDEIIQKKAKLDILYKTKKYNIIIDIKKTVDCRDFPYHVGRYNLYRQSAFYSDGIEFLLNKPTIFIFLTFEFGEPFGVKAFQLDENYIQHGRTANFASIIKWIKWKNEGYPQKIYNEGIEQISIPKYL